MVNSQPKICDHATVKKTTTHGVQSINYHIPSVVDGSWLSIREWLPPPEAATKAVIQLTHGISEHSGRYDRFARYLAENGYRVYAGDLAGVTRQSLGKPASISGPILWPT